MSDEKKKCSGCGREVTGDIGWCMSCRSILYTDLLIARTDFSGSQFKTLVFPVRDIIWMQDRIRLREAELKAADDTNDRIAAELARLRAELEQAPTATLRQQLAGSQSALSKVMGELTEAREQLERRRIDYAKVQADLYNKIDEEKAQTAEAYRQRDVARADLAEARADVSRFEAALDVANRELAEARADASRWQGSSAFYSDLSLMSKESESVLRNALIEIRDICSSMMDGWGQTVTVLEEIRGIAYKAIGAQGGKPPQAPTTFS